jgi:hypothetical protein
MSLEYAKHPTQREAAGVGGIHDVREIQNKQIKKEFLRQHRIVLFIYAQWVNCNLIGGLTGF